jgi:orotidine-5'-phosphate decarboxylase
MTNQILVALDVDTAEAAHALADQLRGQVYGFKIGSRLFTSHGPSIVSALVGRGDRVFLDLKFHDIPNTVAGAVAAAARLGVWMVNVHASGGHAMMKAARDAADAESQKRAQPRPLIIAVTMLTSLSDESMGEIGVAGALAGQVGRLAMLAQSAGLDGVVASPQEIALIRNRCGKTFEIVTPGIRSASDDKGDQSRTLTAGEALAAGASYLVVGRPIIAAADPRAAAERIAAECRAVAR